MKNALRDYILQGKYHIFRETSFENRIISEPYITGKLLNDDIFTFLYNEPNNLVGSNQFTSMTSKRYSTVSFAVNAKYEAIDCVLQK